MCTPSPANKAYQPQVITFWRCTGQIESKDAGSWHSSHWIKSINFQCYFLLALIYLIAWEHFNGLITVICWDAWSRNCTDLLTTNTMQFDLNTSRDSDKEQCNCQCILKTSDLLCNRSISSRNEESWTKDYLCVICIFANKPSPCNVGSCCLLRPSCTTVGWWYWMMVYDDVMWF